MNKVSLLSLIALVHFHASAQTNYLETIKVTDSVYVFKPKIDWSHGNGTAIIGNDGVFFIDTYIMSTYAAEAINRLKTITKLPVKYVLNTHWHYDHVMGNYEFKKSYPGCKFIAQDSTYHYMEKMVRPVVETDLKTTKESIQLLENQIKERKTYNGLSITDTMLPFWEQQIKEANDYIKNYRPLEFVNADITFSDSLTFHWGNQTLRLIHVNLHAHSEGDVIVWIPEKKIVITGDIVVSPTPYETQPNASGMVQAIQTIIDMKPEIIIPGHGIVQHDLTYINLEKEAFVSYLREAENAVKNKIPMMEASKYIKLDDLDYKFTGGDDLKYWAFRSFFKGQVIYQTYKKFNALPPKN